MPRNINDPILRSLRYAGRIPKPSFKSYTTTVIVCPGSAYAPTWFNIGGTIYEVIDDLYLNLKVTGLGGMETGLVASTIYFLYAIASSGNVYLMASTTSPAEGGIKSRGPATYIGAFWVSSSSTTLCVSMNGRYLNGTSIQTYTMTTSGAGLSALTQKTIDVPVTARIALGSPDFQAIGQVGDTSYVFGTTDGSASLFVRTFTQGASFNDYQNNGEVLLITPQTIWMQGLQNGAAACTPRFVLTGWVEDPSEFA